MVAERSWDVCLKLPEERALLQAACCRRCPACWGTPLRLGNALVSELPGALQKSNSKSIASTLPKNWREGCEGTAVTTGDSRKAKAWCADNQRVSQMLPMASLSRARERLMWLMPFSKSSVHWYGSPLFSGVESFQNHTCLWGFWKVK